MPDFEIGDQVTITEDSEYNGQSEEYNPPHGVAGEVTHTASGNPSHPYRVVWIHSNRSNIYRPEDLELLVPKVVKPRASFRNWMLKLEGKTPVETSTSTPFHSLPGTPGEGWSSLLQHYSNTGTINRGLVERGFTWASTEHSEYWMDVHLHGPDLTLAYECLDSWCDQEGYLIPTDRNGYYNETVPTPAENLPW